MKTFLLVLLLSIYCFKAQFFLQSTFQNQRDCDTTKPHQGAAVKKIFFLTKKFPFDKCVKFGPSSQIYSSLNSTHFNVKVYCTDNCETCQGSTAVAYTCQHFPGQPFSLKTSSGLVPEIKKKGFLAKLYSNSKCEGDFQFISFVTDAICMNSVVTAGFPKMEPKLMKSMFTGYNTESEQAEIIAYKDLGCTGEIVQKQTFPINKCVSAGSPDMFVLVEKSFK
jgi:hypothetical protein